MVKVKEISDNEMILKHKHGDKDKMDKLDTTAEALFHGLNLVDDDPNHQLHEEFEENE